MTVAHPLRCIAVPLADRARVVISRPYRCPHSPLRRSRHSTTHRNRCQQTPSSQRDALCRRRRSPPRSPQAPWEHRAQSNNRSAYCYRRGTRPFDKDNRQIPFVNRNRKIHSAYHCAGTPYERRSRSRSSRSPKMITERSKEPKAPVSHIGFVYYVTALPLSFHIVLSVADPSCMVRIRVFL